MCFAISVLFSYELMIHYGKYYITIYMRVPEWIVKNNEKTKIKLFDLTKDILVKPIRNL